jgi:hypothetical protein
VRKPHEAETLEPWTGVPLASIADLLPRQCYRISTVQIRLERFPALARGRATVSRSSHGTLCARPKFQDRNTRLRARSNIRRCSRERARRSALIASSRSASSGVRCSRQSVMRPYP